MVRMHSNNNNLNYVYFISIFFASLSFLNYGRCDYDSPIKSEDFNKFKSVMTYFNEPLLDSASIENLFFKSNDNTVKKGKAFEGSKKNHMAQFLSEQIKSMTMPADELNEFGTNLENGNEFIKNFFAIDEKEYLVAIKAAKTIQDDLIDKLKKTGKLVIPYAWHGSDPHAIGIIIEKLNDSKFNLIIVNAGDGIEYHYGKNDPNNLNLNLKRLWIEFLNIPEKEIFDDDAWFVQALIRLRIPNSATKIFNNSGTLASYFYGSILTNFREYLSNPDDSQNKWLTYQRSGSCALSSLMSSYLYYAKSDLSFHYNRILLGQTLLEKFLNEFSNENENNPNFNKLITDGFDLISRKLFKSTASSLAYQILVYLEFKLPSVFKNAGLLGEGRSSWVTSKKLDAISALKNESVKDTLILIRKSIELALRIHNILLKNQINQETNNITINSKLRTLNPRIFTYLTSNLDFSQAGGSNFYEFLKDPIKRNTVVHDSMESVFNFLTNCMEENLNSKYTCILDVFRKSKSESKNWWDYDIGSVVPLNFLQLCEKIIKDFIQSGESGETPTSLEDILMLAHVQLGSWKMAQLYDEKQKQNENENDENHIFYLGLSNFRPPLIIHAILSKTINEQYESITSGNYEIWPVRTSFNADTLKELSLVLESYLKIGSDSGERFLGPNELLDKQKQYTSIWKYSYAYGKITKSKQNYGMYQKILSNKKIAAKIQIQRQKDKKSDTQKISWKAAIYTNYAILISHPEEFYKNLPHFYHLMNSLIWTYQGASRRPFQADSTKSMHALGLNDKEYASITISNQIKTLIFYNHEQAFDFRTISDWKFMKVELINEPIFYRIRHSQALINYSPTKIDFESWLNYVKGVQDAKIFDSPYFSYLSDRILNMPTLILDKSSYKFDLRVEATYPSGFKDFHVREVFNSIFKLVNIDLDYITEKKDQLELTEMSKLVKRSVNISIPLVRFLARIDNDSFISADSVASMLAKLYLTFYKFSPKKGNTGLGDSEISTVNLVLAQICDIRIRNPKTFLDKIKAGLNLPKAKTVDLEMFRKSLARVHWFLARIFYSITQIGTNHADDLFNLGFVYYPVAINEVPFMNVMLNKLFLVAYTDVYVDKFDYYMDGDIVRMSYSGATISKPTIMAIQLSRGNVVLNGTLQIEKQTLLNNYNFRSFFPLEDINNAANGEITKIGLSLIYILKDYKYKGNTIVVLSKGDACEFYRKYNNKWYKWDSRNLSTFHDGSQYRWTLDYKLYTEVKSDLADIPINVVLLANYKEEPLFTATLKSPDNGNHISKFSTEIKIEGCSHGLEVIDYNPAETSADYFERHLQRFTNSGTIVAKQNTQQKELAVIYPGLRFAQDPNRPLTLLEFDAFSSTQKNAKFQILNLPGFFVESLQVASLGIGITGTLTIQNNDGQRFVMVPLKYFDAKIDEKTPPYIVELIPIVSGLPAPQTRIQRILLAYYSLNAHEYASARELLNPWTSLNQNEVFSVNELEIMSWIVNVKKRGPEGSALMLMVYAHITINKAKFPLEYVIDPADKSPEGVLKNQRGKFFDDIKKNISSNFVKYIYSIRELPEKFNVFRIFPELLENSSIKQFIQTIGVKKNMPTDAYATKSPEIECHDDNGQKRITFISKLNTLGFDGVKDIFITGFFNVLMHEPKNEILKQHLKNMSKLIYRANKGDSMNNKRNEMIIYCAAKDIEPWIEIANKNVAEYCSLESDLRDDDKLNDLKKIISKQIDSCNLKYGKDFEPINLSTKSEPINSNLIINSLKSDVKKIFPVEDKLDFSIFGLKLVNQEDLDEFVKIEQSLRPIIKLNKTVGDLGFNEENLKQSDVLRKLVGSMTKFITENGQYTDLEIEFAPETVTALKKFIFYLESRLHEISVLIKEMAQNLMDKVTEINFESKDLPHTIEVLNRLMHQRKIKKFESLYSCYQRQSVSCLQTKFGHFTHDECKQLLKDTLLFYTNQVLHDFLKTMLEISDKFYKSTLKREPVNVDDLVIFLDEVIKIKSFNDRLKSPAILNFEFRSKRYRLRSEQVEDIARLTSIDSNTNNFKSSVIQRMMAAGKTLVLGTISVVTKALDNTKLSILVPPSSLYQSNLSAMQARTYTFFKTKGHNFIFTRFQLTSIEVLTEQIIPFLESITKQINSVMAASEYFVLSPDSLQAFLNSYIEILNFSTENWDPNVIKALQLYGNIYTIFKTKGSIILDEIDMTMDPKKELNFPTIDNEPFNLTAAVLITDLIEFSVFSDEVQSIGLDILGNNQSSLTAENYKKYIEILIRYIKNELENPKSLWSEKILNLNIEPHDFVTKEKIITFLSDPDIAFMKTWIEGLKKLGRPGEADALVIIKVQIWLNIKEVFNFTANLNYGAAGSNRPNTKYAVPYLAANTPSPSSEFADRWETLNKTLLMLASVNCSESLAKDMIKYLRKTAIRETALNDIDETPTAKNVANLLRGKYRVIEFDDQNKDQIKSVHEALITRSPTAIRLLFSFALDKIFSDMKFPVEQITSNALNMTSMFGSVQGYSGTIDNVNILPRDVLVDAYKNHEDNEKNNGGISLKLIKDSLKTQDNVHVYQLTDSILKENVELIIEAMIDNSLNDNEKNELSAIIDAGAFFKNFKNREVAKAILTILRDRIKIVLYYDEESNQVEFIRSESYAVGYISSTDPESIYKATQTEINKRFTYYDQRHITGSDILQPKTARALMTVGTRVLLRDILQGTLRMRQFMSSQKVHLVTSVAAANFYFSKSKFNSQSRKIKVTDILALGSFNEDAKQTVENERLAFTKIDSEIRRFVLEEVTRAIKSSKNSKNVVSAYFALDNTIGTRHKNIRDLFIRLIRENPLEWMYTPKKEKSQIVLSNYANFWLDQIKQLSPKIVPYDSNFNVLDPNSDSGKSFIELENVFGALTAPNNYDNEPDNEPDNENENDLYHDIEPNNENASDNDVDHQTGPPKNKNLNSLMAFLASKINTRRSVTDGGNEIEMQVFTQQLVEFDLESMSQRLNFKPVYKVASLSFDFEALLSIPPDGDIEDLGSKAKVFPLIKILNDSTISSTHINLAVSATISKGKQVFVSRELTEMIQEPLDKKYPSMIFSKYSWEASHILVQVFAQKSGIRLILLPTEGAFKVQETIKSKSFDSKGNTLWLCDLSGRVTLTNDTLTMAGMNILDIISESQHVLFFDALIFNGSFDQIISNEKYLKTIYKDNWLHNPDHFQSRAKFLLLRMYVLANKASYLFSDDNLDYELLNRAARGDKDVLCSSSSSASFKKPPITNDEEESFFKKSGKKRPELVETKQKTSVISPGGIYREITGQLSELDESSAAVSMTFKLTDLKTDKDDNKDRTSDAVNYDFVDHKYPQINYWKNIKNDVSDVNDFVKANINPTKKVDNYFILVIVIIIVLLVLGALYLIYTKYKKSPTKATKKKGKTNSGEGPFEDVENQGQSPVVEKIYKDEKSDIYGDKEPDNDHDIEPDIEPDNNHDNEPDNNHDNEPDNNHDNEPDNDHDNEPDNEPDNENENDLYHDIKPNNENASDNDVVHQTEP